MNYINFFQQHRVRLFLAGGDLDTGEVPADTNQGQESAGPPQNPKHGDLWLDPQDHKKKIYDATNQGWLDMGDEQSATRVTEIMREAKEAAKAEKKQARAAAKVAREEARGAFNNSFAQKAGIDSSYIGEGKGQISTGAAAAIGGMATVGVLAMNAVDQLAMGDKNFGSQSQAIDDAVHGVSGALIKSGNPYAMAAGAGLEAANFMTKATGQNTLGYDVDISSSGYGQLGHKDSSASRDFLGAIGLGGLDGGMMDRKLASRNELALMALKASNVADNIKFQQEARMNSVDDVLRQNLIALAGGLDTTAIAN